jgi:60 kDa SS-A/Ro ribonucleoprotein
VATAYTDVVKTISKKDGERVANSTGIAYNILAEDFVRLDRFLLLGTSGGTFYANERDLTKQNADHLIYCLDTYGVKVVERIVEVSEQGLAPKQQPAIFALAVAAAHTNVEVRKAALNSLSQVCRTASTLFQFLEYVTYLRGWGRTLKRAVANWYNNKSASDIAYQAVKYRNRNGWTHKDALQLSHTLAGDDPESMSRKELYNWIYDETTIQRDKFFEDIEVVYTYVMLQMAESELAVIRLIKANPKTPFEAIPNQWLKSSDVWKQLITNGMPTTALIRNLSRITSLGVLDDPLILETVVNGLTNAEKLKKSRVHPMNIYNALISYQKGVGRNLTWLPNRRIIDALDSAFYLAFKNVTPSNKRILVAIDISSSMSSYKANGFEGISAAQAASAMALVTIATEPYADVVVFDDTARWSTISPSMRLDVVHRELAYNRGYTNCAAPFQWIIENEKTYDAVVMYTDSETNVDGSLAYHYARTSTGPNPNYVYNALDAVRGLGPHDMKLVNVAMSANDLSFSRKTDVNTLDVAGFSADTPQAISLFIAGNA